MIETNQEELEKEMEVYESVFHTSNQRFPKFHFRDYRIRKAYDKLYIALSGISHPFYDNEDHLIDILSLKHYAQKTINSELKYSLKLTDIATHCITYITTYYYIVEIDLDNKTHYLPFFINFKKG